MSQFLPMLLILLLLGRHRGIGLDARHALQAL